MYIYMWVDTGASFARLSYKHTTCSCSLSFSHHEKQLYLSISMSVMILYPVLLVEWLGSLELTQGWLCQVHMSMLDSKMKWSITVLEETKVFVSSCHQVRFWFTLSTDTMCITCVVRRILALFQLYLYKGVLKSTYPVHSYKETLLSHSVRCYARSCIHTCP